MTDVPPQDEMTGKLLGQFEIQDEIGRGGMASVYRARQKSMNRLVAVKILPPHLLHDPSFYERFEREVDVIAHLEHPHILPIYDYGQSQGIPYIAMRYLGGGSMEQWIERDPIKLENLEGPLTQVAQALDYAHSQGIIHRDLKPANIMLDENGNAYLSDFGIARVLGSNLTGSMIVGTPAYMSPEQANGLPVDGRSDVYSLGVTLFQLITGRKPFQAETPMAVLLKHINEPMPSLDEFRPGLSSEINDVIFKATAKNPDERYSSAVEMVEAFNAAVRNNATSIGKSTRTMPEPMPAPQSVIPASVAPGPTAAAVPQGETASKSSRRPLWMGLVAVLGIAVIAAFVLLSQGDESDGGATDAIPTPFAQAVTVETDRYTISVPQSWNTRERFLDQSDADRMVHIWRQEDNLASVELSLVDVGVEGGRIPLQQAAQQYAERFLVQRADFLERIDQDVAEDGTIRQSFWFDPPETINADRRPLLAQRLDLLKPGQLDVYFMRKGPYLVVVQLFTAAESGNTLVPTLQDMLDSLRIISETT